MMAIYKKELKTYFYTSSGCIFIGIYLAIYAGFFVGYNIMGDNADIGGVMDNMIVALVLLIPILTMRLFSEEKHMHTDKVYLSAPISLRAIVLGKYFAACTVFALTQIITIISGIIMVVLGGQTIEELMSLVIGYFLVGAVFTAVGMFASSLVENQIISAVTSFAMCLFFYLFDIVSDAAYGTPFEKAAQLPALAKHYENFPIGIFDCTAVIYFISFAALFVVFTVLKLEADRCKRS